MIESIGPGNVCTCGHLRAAHVFDETTLAGATCIARTGVNDCGINPTYCKCGRFVVVDVPAAPSLSAALASWNAHQRGCPQCLNTPNSAGLCLAGSVLWQRAGLEVIPVPVPQALPLDRRGSRVMRTSELLREAAEWIAGADDVLAAELRIRAAYLETLGDHDLPNGGAR